ncbi:MAG: chlorite dismutase family protein, partial [Pirellulaceae bacterium]|nr:chlorite dismutase family protein [Pirellulaceae bacterium]
MSHGSRPPQQPPVEPSLELESGWHCNHLYYSFDRAVLAQLSPGDVTAGRAELVAALDPTGPDAPVRLQTSVVSGHKADFGLMLLDDNPLKIDALHQRLMASRLGPALTSAYSFVSVTEISEYVPSVEQYAQRLIQEGEEEGSPAYNAKVKAYEGRLPA